VALKFDNIFIIEESKSVSENDGLLLFCCLNGLIRYNGSMGSTV